MSNNNPTDVFSLPYTEWLEKTLQELVKFPVKGICICVTTGEGEVYVNYHKISMVDKLVVSGIIQQDAMLDTLAANGVVEYADDEEEGGESDGEEEVS